MREVYLALMMKLLRTHSFNTIIRDNSCWRRSTNCYAKKLASTTKFNENSSKVKRFHSEWTNLQPNWNERIKPKQLSQVIKPPSIFTTSTLRKLSFLNLQGLRIKTKLKTKLKTKQTHASPSDASSISQDGSIPCLHYWDTRASSRSGTW
jgi:hypothetical protein